MLKVVTAAEMRDIDRRTIELGIPESILMENAGHRVVEFLVERFSPLDRHRIVVLCGKGNNGGDGFVVARQLWTRFRPEALHVVAVNQDGAPSLPRKMLEATGCPVSESIQAEMEPATLVIDALLGTGLTGPARGQALDAIQRINQGFRFAKVVAVDVPSGMSSDSGTSAGEVARADATVTFTAPRLCHVLSPNCDRIGELRVAAIGTPNHLLESVNVLLPEPFDFRPLFVPRNPDSNKGSFGHVLVVGGAEGKSGAAEMAGIAALRSGAGLVTVASSVSRLNTLELMTESLPSAQDQLKQLLERRTVLAIGPGLGSSDAASTLVLSAITEQQKPVVVDADGLNAIAGKTWRACGPVVITPHPGEMARLSQTSISAVQQDRLGTAKRFAYEHGCFVVLKGHRTVVASPHGRCWINTTGSPAMATGGTGDILTGLTAGLIAQHPENVELAVLAAVWLHGRAGELGAQVSTEQTLIATDLLLHLPEAIRFTGARA